MVEGLGGQHAGPLRPAVEVGDAGGRLHEGVEAAPVAPRPRRPPGRQPDGDEVGMPLGQRRGSQPERVERAGPVALDDDVGLREQFLHGPPVRRAGEVQDDVPLADAGVDQPAAVVGQPRAVDPQHVGAVGRERAGGHRAGDDPGEVEDAQAVGGSVGGPARRATRRSVIRGSARDRRALRMLAPLRRRAHRGRRAPGRDHRRLQVLGPPPRRGARRRRPPARRARRPGGAGSCRAAAASRRPCARTATAARSPARPGARRAARTARCGRRGPRAGRRASARRSVPGQLAGGQQLGGHGADGEPGHRQRTAQPGPPSTSNSGDAVTGPT